MTETRSNAEMARAYVDDAMSGRTDTLAAAYGRDAVLTAANVLAVLATADAMRPAPPVMVNLGDRPLTETGRLVLQRQLDQALRIDDLHEHEIKVGDPDPTPPGGWNGTRCWRSNPITGHGCHARTGHAGQHVRGYDGMVTEVWS